MFDSPIAAWRQFDMRYRLEGNQCEQCKKTYLPATKYCSCGSTNFQAYCPSIKGTLLSFTQVHVPPIEYKDIAPYCIGLVQLSDGHRMVVQLTDVTFEELAIGIPVCGVFRRLYAQKKGMIHYGLKFTVT